MRRVHSVLICGNVQGCEEMYRYVHRCADMCRYASVGRDVYVVVGCGGRHIAMRGNVCVSVGKCRDVQIRVGICRDVRDVCWDGGGGGA